MHPTATWEVRRFGGLPYLVCEAGVFVEVAVTVEGVTLSQLHPVLDHRNRPISAPTAFEINTSIQRALVKAIALHGLGLYIYAGEDLPSGDTGPAANDADSASTAPRPEIARITRAQQTQIHKLALEVGVELTRGLTYFGVRELHEIAATDFVRVLRSLEKRRNIA